MSEETKQNTTEDQDRPAEQVPDESGAAGQAPETSAPGEERPAPQGDLEQQLAGVRDQLLRKAADFENYKKRMESEVQGLIRMANEGVILSILPVVDDLERSLKAEKTAHDVAAFQKGVELIYQKLRKVLESHGVTPLETAGKPFDVHYHDALMQMPKDDVEPNTVVEEVEKGYSMNGKVIRHAKVIVSAPPAGQPASSDNENDEEAGT